MSLRKTLQNFKFFPAFFKIHTDKLLFAEREKKRLQTSGALAQNFPPAMVSSRGPYHLLTRKDSQVFMQKGPFQQKGGPFCMILRGAQWPRAGRPVGQSATATNYEELIKQDLRFENGSKTSAREFESPQRIINVPFS